MSHIKQNIAPIVALTFQEGLKDLKRRTEMNQSLYAVTAYKLGEINLNEEIGDPIQFLRRITEAMYPNYDYPADWLTR